MNTSDREKKLNIYRQIIGTFSFLDFLSVSMRHMRLTHRGEEMLLFLVTSVSSFVLCDLPECFDESVFALCNNG